MGISETISVQIREDGSRVVTRSIREIGGAARDSAGDVSGLQTSLKASMSKISRDIANAAKSNTTEFQNSASSIAAAMQRMTSAIEKAASDSAKALERAAGERAAKVAEASAARVAKANEAAAAKTAREAERAAKAQETAAARAAKAAEREAAKTARASEKAARDTERAAAKAAAATEREAAKAARAVERAKAAEARAANKSSSGDLGSIKGLVGAAGAYFAVSELREYIDAWSNFVGTIRVVTSSTEEATAVTEKLFGVAQRSRQEIDAVGKLYGQVSRSAHELGVSQNDVIKFTELVGKTLAYSHTSTEESRGALLQLGQALGSGKVRAQEFNSVLMGAPAILQQVANNVKGADGSVAKLRTIMLSGKLTSREFFDAMLKGAPDIEAKFGKASYTIGQGFTLIGNAFTKWIGELAEKSGAIDVFGKSARWISQNMGTVASSIAAVGTAIAIAFAPTVLAKFMNALQSLTVAVAANPYLALAAAVAGVATYLVMMRDQIRLGIDDTTSLGDLMDVVGGKIKNALGITEAPFTTMVADAGVKFREFGEGTIGVMEEVNKTTETKSRSTFGTVLGIALGIYNVLSRTAKAVGDVTIESFKMVSNSVAELFGKLTNLVIEGINKLNSLVGIAPMEPLKIKLFEVDQKLIERSGKSIMESFADGMKSADDILAEAAKKGRDRVESELSARRKGEAALNQKGTPGKVGMSDKELKKAAREREKLTNDTRSLLNTIAPSEGAIMEKAKAMDTLNKAVAKGIDLGNGKKITDEDEVRYAKLLELHYRDIVDPIGRYNREIAQQTNLLSLDVRSRSVMTDLLAKEAELRSKGHLMTTQEKVDMMGRLESLRDLNEEIAAQDRLLGDSVEKRRAFNVEASALSKVTRMGGNGFTTGDANAAAMSMVSGMGIDTSTMQGQRSAELAAQKTHLSQLAALHKGGSISAEDEKNAQYQIGMKEIDLKSQTPQSQAVGALNSMGVDTSATDAQEALWQSYYDKINLMRQNDLISEETASSARAQIALKEKEVRVNQADQLFGTLATLQNNSVREIAAIGKAAAIAQATINTYEGATKALAQGGTFGPILAGVVIAAGMANIAQMTAQSLGFATGGSFVVGGQGGVDSRMVAFRASPGEQVTVATPTQVRKGTEQDRQDQSQQPSFKIVNVIDPKESLAAMRTPAGERVIMNVIQRNPAAIRKMLGA